MDENLLHFLSGADEIWHAGDWGHASVAEMIEKHCPGKLRGVYGNIDGQEIRGRFPEKLHFSCEAVKVYMTHIGGYPKKYAPGIKDEIIAHQSGLFICGHSHILKVMYDEEVQCLHMNPGAAGKQGWQKHRTILRFVIDGKDIKDAEVVELK